MPPAISDDEMESEGLDVPDSIPAKGKIPTKAQENEVKDEGEEEGEDDDEEDEEFSVERIIKHDFSETGVVLYQVKWLGYEKKSDLTWEPVENLENALELLDQYHNTIGGPPVYEPEPQPSSKKKGGKRSASAAFSPAVESSSTKKRGRKSTGAETNGATPTSRERKLPDGNWESLVQRVQSIVEEDDASGKAGKGRDTKHLIGMLEWNDGGKTQHSMAALRRKVPQKLLDYYEQHLRFEAAD